MDLVLEYVKLLIFRIRTASASILYILPKSYLFIVNYLTLKNGSPKETKSIKERYI